MLDNCYLNYCCKYSTGHFRANNLLTSVKQEIDICNINFSAWKLSSWSSASDASSKKIEREFLIKHGVAVAD